MKLRIFTLAFLLFISNNIISQSLVVALHSSNGVQFFADDNPLVSAYEAAVDNDTLYLPGGTLLPPAKFEKELTIYGAGHYPIATPVTLPTTISGNFKLGDAADGFHLEGVVITGYLDFENNKSINDVTIKRCKINTYLYVNGNRSAPSENNTFVENVFIHNITIPNLLNSTFFNNIIQSYIDQVRNIVFLNNDFIYPYGSGLGYANACMFKNNVFYRNNTGICAGAGSSTWMYNIFTQSNPILGTNSTSANNYQVNFTDIFVDQSDYAFDYSDDFHLQSAAATNLGDDGTVTGIYGGFYPWKTSSIPVTPNIKSATISGTTNSSGNIHINITVEAQDN